MKLSEYAGLHGIHAFTRADFEFVGSKVTTDPGRLILVGGQAIEVWGAFLNVPAPAGQHETLTEDTDWLGSESDARWLCEQLGNHELKIAKDWLSPNTAIAYLQRPDGRILLMDFLRTIIGPSPQEVERLAVSVKIKDITIRVLHPLLCLESRIANLAALPSKRNGNGFQQAEWAIAIVSAFIEYIAQNHSIRHATRACHWVERIALSRDAKYCYQHFGIDPFRAVTGPTVQLIGGQFVAQDWPRVVARVARKRGKWRKPTLSVLDQGFRT